MKTLLSLFGLLFLLLENSRAIPQQVGVTGFTGAVGMQFEQFAAAQDVWAPGAELKGKWQVRAGNAAQNGVETLDLAMEADVFGIPATQVSAERVGGVVRRFVVRFAEAKLKDAARAKGGDLFARITTNLQAMAGEPTVRSPGGELTFRHEAATIVARRDGARAVVVEFTPAR